MPDTAGSPRSSASSDSFSSGRQSPIHGFDSSAALILVPDADESASNTPFDFTSDDENDGMDDEVNGQAERVQASAIPPMPPLTVFAYLLAPFLRLGALLLPDAGLPLKTSIPVLLFFAGLSAFTRQIWYMLARYVGRADMEEIVLETFVRERSREGRRRILRQLVRFCSGAFRVLLSAMYLRVSVDALLPLLPETLFLPRNLVVSTLLALAVSPFYFASTLAANRVIYATWISYATYAAWFGCRVHAHTQGIVVSSVAPPSLGLLWQGISPMVFTFTTSSTIPLYAALRGTVQPLTTRPRQSHSFKLLSVMSVGIALLCTLPLAFFQASDTPSPQQTSPQTLTVMTAAFYTATLVLAIPSVLIPAPALPIPLSLRRVSSFPFSRLVLYLIPICLSVLPWPLSPILSDITWLLAFLSTYMLPAFIHIVLHNLRRPLSIIIPPTTPVLTSPSSAQAVEGIDSRHDELLQRKERTLQRRRLGRRIVWDIGVWVLLVPVGGGGLVWAAGRLSGRW